MINKNQKNIKAPEIRFIYPPRDLQQNYALFWLCKSLIWVIINMEEKYISEDKKGSTRFAEAAIFDNLLFRYYG